MAFSITYQSNSEYLTVPTLRGRAIFVWKPFPNGLNEKENE